VYGRRVVTDEVVEERPEGIARGKLPVEPLTLGLVAAVPVVVFVLLVVLRIRKTLRERRGPTSSRRGGSLRPPPPGAR
jgi:hypothetical protein